MSRALDMKWLRAAHRRESWVPGRSIMLGDDVVGRAQGQHRVSLRQWLRALPHRDMHLVGKAARIAAAVLA